MTDRFFCSDLATAHAILADAEAHHAQHVRRVKPGDSIELFDGRGTVASGTVDSVSRREVVVAIDRRKATARSTREKVTVAAAVPKGDRLKWMIEKLTELGVDRYIPLVCERSAVGPRKSKLSKLEATIVSAAKQCGRNWLLEVSEPTDVAAVICETKIETQIHLAHPYPIESVKAPNVLPDVAEHLILVGPEGGFTDAEVAAAITAGAARLEWPSSILRIETAAIMAAVVVTQISRK